MSMGVINGLEQVVRAKESQMKPFMIFAMTLLGFSGTAETALSQNRQSTRNMSCEETKALITRSGAIILNTGEHSFDRLVHHRGFCAPDEISVPTWAPTRDNPACMVGYRCESEMGRAPTPR